MKKISPVSVASTLLVILLAINAILLATRKPSSGAADDSARQPQATTNTTANAAVAKPAHIVARRASSSYDSKGIHVFFGNVAGMLATPEGHAGITVSPSVEGGLKLEQSRWYNGDTVLELKGDFQRDTTYSVHIPAGLRDSASNTLERAVAFSVRIPPLPTSIAFRLSGFYLQGKGARKIPIRLTNVGRIEYTLMKHYENNLNISSGRPRWWSWDNTSWEADMMVDVGSTTREYDLPRNKAVDVAIDLGELFGDLQRGVYRIIATVFDKAGNYQGSSSAWFSISDMAIQTAIDTHGRKAVVFARSISDDSPVANANVCVISCNNQTIAEGRTDANGSALLKFKAEYNLAVDSPKSVMVTTDTDMTFEELDDEHRTDIGLHPSLGNARAAADHPEAFVFAERGIYRPGEKVVASAFVRETKSGATRAVAGSPVLFTLHDPNGKEVSRARTETDGHGFTEATFALGRDAKTGNYQIFCGPTDKDDWGDTKVLVSAFVPDRVKASMKSDVVQGAPVGPDATVTYETTANYYFGTPVESFDYDFNAMMDPMESLPKHLNGWKVGDGSQTRNELGRTKGNGTNRMEIAVAGLDKYVGKVFAPQLIKAWNSVLEAGGRAVTAFAPSIPFHPTPSYIGLRHLEGSGEGDLVELALLPAIAGDSVEPLQVNLTLTRKEWEFEFYEDGNRTRRRWVEKTIAMPDFDRDITATGDIAKLPLANIPFGRYTLVATAEGRKTVMEFWHDAGEGGIRSGDPKIVEFKLNAEKFKPGDVARISFEAIGAGEAFLVCGESAIDANTSFKVKAGTNAFDFQVPPSVVGNAYHFGVTVVSRDADNILQRQFGILSLNIDQSRFGMSVAIDAPEKTEPKSEIEVAVHLRDAANAPVSGLVRLYAVDEGILSLTQYKTPDPLAFFHCGRYCGFSFFDLYDDIIPELAITPDPQIGGDIYISAANRSKIRNVESAVVVSAPLEVGESGEASVKLKLPNHTGELRIMVVAAGETLMGAAQRPLVMREVATATASAPRAVAPGDEFDMTCKLFNHECDNGRFAFALSLPDGVSPSDDGAAVSWSGVIQRGASTNIVVRMRAGDVSGFRNLSITNSLAIGDRLLTGETLVTIRPVNPPMTATKTMAVKPGESVELSADPGEWSADAVSKIEVMAHPATGLRDAAVWLDEYPYGCLEQTTSTAFPLLAANDLAKAGLIDQTIAETARAKISYGIARIKSMQLADGSFTMWPGGDYSADGYVVLYAIHFLIEAHRQGFSPTGIDDTVANYIKRTFIDSTASRTTKGMDAQASAFHSDFEQAYAAYLLVLAGKSDEAAPTLRNLLIGEGDSTACFKVIAATALAKAGYAGEAAATLRGFVTSDSLPISDIPEDCHLWYMDRTSLMGLLLHAVMEVLPDPATATRLATYIASQQRPGNSAWGTPHSNAWAMLGLARYCSICKPGDIDFFFASNGGAQQHVTLPANGKSHSFAIDVGDGSASLRNDGATPLFAAIRTSGIPRNPPSTGGNVKLSREFFDADGNAIAGPVAHGDLIEVRISIENAMALDEAILCDILPGGLEIEDERLATRAKAFTRADKSNGEGIHVACMERGDDRFLLFADIAPGRHSVSYRVRAVTPGRYSTAPSRIECMYNPDITGTFYDGATIEIAR